MEGPAIASHHHYFFPVVFYSLRPFVSFLTVCCHISVSKFLSFYSCALYFRLCSFHHFFDLVCLCIFFTLLPYYFAFYHSLFLSFLLSCVSLLNVSFVLSPFIFLSLSLSPPPYLSGLGENYNVECGWAPADPSLC